MKNLLSLSFCLTLAFASYGQERVLLGGILKNHVSGEGIESVHVLNLTDSLATISNADGAFKIPAHLGDSIVFTSIGFFTKAIIVNAEHLAADFITIKLASRGYELSEVEVNPFGTKEQFREKFMALEVDDGTIEIAGIKKPSKNPRTIPITEDKNEIKKAKYILNPASFLYGNFSKDAKMRQELHRLNKEKERHKNNSKKFNEDVVYRITKYEDERLIEFMNYCNFSQSQILRYSQYELTVAILNKQRAFERISKQADGK
ncbi:MAG: hypothetical protein ACPGU4_10030 [Flavobacteriales bacterium]